MNYEGQICRGPMERSSYMLPVAVGCSYNRCKFCTLFRHLKYRELPMEQIEAELERVRSLGGNPKHVFLGDGNAFGLGTKRLLEITDLIHRYFPDCQAINLSLIHISRGSCQITPAYTAMTGISLSLCARIRPTAR